ncbi:MAG: TraR/DksA C4-type zinc finger protein [bacterium]
MLSKEQLEQIKKRLETAQKELEEEVKSLGSTDFGDDIDSGDEESDETEEIINNEATQELLQTRLRAITEALAKIEAGTYGSCEKCNAELSEAMIEADPESHLCKECKKADETL